jgi:HEAT repeat protein
VWTATDELVLDVSDTQLRWEDAVVYEQTNKGESISWTLYKDGVRSVTLKPGVEDEEFVRLLGVLNRAKNLAADAADDLLTLLWEQDFQLIQYTFKELLTDPVHSLEPVQEMPTSPPTDVQRQVREEAPERPAGVVSMEDFEGSLYFLDEKEINFLKEEVEREYTQDLRRNVLAMLFDLTELQTYSTVRAELVSIVENFIPYLLGAGDFRSVAYILRETRLVLQRAREMIPEHRQALEGLPARLSQPEPLAQLLQSLDESSIHPTEEELGELFLELRPEALGTLMAWLPRLTNQRVKDLVTDAAIRLAQQHTGEVIAALNGTDPAVVMEMVRLVGRLKLQQAVDATVKLLAQGDLQLKMAVIEALVAIGSPGALRGLEGAVEDGSRDVRIAAVRCLGQRGYRNALPRIEGVITGGKLKGADLTERIAFFEAFGALAGDKGVPTLDAMLNGKGMFGKKEDTETRACAAMALGKIRTAGAKGILDKAAGDKEPLVRNAVNRALREIAA